MFAFGKVTCSFCEGRVSGKDALKARDWIDVIVCARCYAKWEGEG